MSCSRVKSEFKSVTPDTAFCFNSSKDYASCSSVQVFHQARLRGLFSLSLKGRAAEWYRLLKDDPSIGKEEIVPLFYSKFYPSSEIHQDHNQICIPFGLMMERVLPNCGGD
jgi:hypothetical protein